MGKGNSFANGGSNSGQGDPYRWGSGYQTVRPVTIYDELEWRPAE